MFEFFLVTLPGLEQVALNEFRQWFKDWPAEVVYGGVTVKAPLPDGLAMNQVLKVPTRVLLRVMHFRCRDFPKLFQKISEFNWSPFLTPDCSISAEASSRESRLKIKKRIEETTVDGFHKWQKIRHARVNPDKPVKLYVRFLKDDCVVSVDTSGDRLHKRGVRSHIGVAPLRETIAAAVIQMVEATYKEPLKRPVEIIDPMLGSGTFLIEAAVHDQIIDSRSFAFQSMSCGAPKTPEPIAGRTQFSKLIGIEKDPKTLKAAEENWQRSGVSLELKFIHGDVHAIEPLPPTENERWLMTNPPYNERIKVKEPLADYYEKLFAACEKLARPTRAAFLIPNKAVKGKFRLPTGWKVLAKYPFSNGGIGVVAFIFGRDV